MPTLGELGHFPFMMPLKGYLLCLMAWEDARQYLNASFPGRTGQVPDAQAEVMRP